MTRQILSPYRDVVGLGFVVRDGDTQGYFGHSGGTAGYFAHFEMLADTGQGIVVITNADAGVQVAAPAYSMKPILVSRFWPTADVVGQGD